MASLSVRHWLLIMLGAVLAPVSVLVSALLILQYNARAEAFEGALLSSSRRLALQGEALLGKDRAKLEALSVQRSLQTGDFKAFEQELRQAAASKDGWFVLANDAQQLINTRAEPGAALPSGGFPREAWQALQLGRTRVSGITWGTLAQRPIIAIDTPVVVGPRLYALSFIQEPGRYLPLLNGQIRSPRWIGVILDADGRIVARTLNSETSVGRPATPDLRSAVRAGQEGLIRSRTLEGEPSVLAFSRAPSGWTFVLAVPQDELRSAAWESVLAAAAQLFVLLGAALGAAAFFSRRIVRDLRNLEAAAAALGERRAVDEAPAAFLETASVQRAMAAASSQLLRHDAEQEEALRRQKTLVNELNHRVKNTLATVQSLARQSQRSADPPASLSAFEDRLVALSRAHDLLTANSWQRADLRDLARAVLEPYANARVDGPPVSVSSYAAVSLVLVLHELATNAVKYGALSGGGRVELSWRLAHDRSSLDLEWTEHGAPMGDRSRPGGFGSRLIRATVERELQGKMRREWSDDGVRYEFHLPMSDRLTGQAQHEAAS